MRLAHGYMVYFLRLFYLQEQKKQCQTQKNVLPHQPEKPGSIVALDTI